MKRILFLDIDGVLKDNSSKSLNPFLVANLRHCVSETGCQIVISSDWRFGSIETIKRAFDCSIVADAVIGVTGEGNCREEEILGWVAENGADIWVAVDDLDLELDDRNFVRVDSRFGFDSAAMGKAIERLK